MIIPKKLFSNCQRTTARFAVTFSTARYGVICHLASSFQTSIHNFKPASSIQGGLTIPLTLGQKAARIKLLILDVDGVLTGGEIILGSGGMELKSFNTRDGLGIMMARQSGLEVAIITGRVSEAVEARGQRPGDQGVSARPYGQDRCLCASCGETRGHR